MARWYRFDLPELPYHDREGRVLKSIEGRLNRPGVDEFSGGGRVYPDLTGAGIVERREAGGVLLVSTEADPAAMRLLGGVPLTEEEALATGLVPIPKDNEATQTT